MTDLGLTASKMLNLNNTVQAKRSAVLLGPLYQRLEETRHGVCYAIISHTFIF